MTTPDAGPDTGAVGSRHRRRRTAALLARLIEPRVFGPLVGAIAVTASLAVIHAISRHVRLEEIQAALIATPAAKIFQALLLTALSLLALSLYDVLAVRRVAPRKVSTRLAAFAGLVGYGFSNAIGLHALVGGPIHYRIYQTAGLDASDVARIIGISLLTFSGGMLAIIGAALLLDPSGIPVIRDFAPLWGRVVGAGIVIVIALAIGWLAFRRGDVSILGWRLPLPPPQIAIAQILVGAIDIGATAACLYLLLPTDLVPGYAAFLPIFVLATIAGIVSHAPGGFGVFEATILLGLGAGARPEAIAALLVFRIIYYLVPLCIAAVGFLLFVSADIEARFRSASARAVELARLVVPPIATVLVFSGGVTLLVSSVTPAVSDRHRLLSHLLPLPFAEASHLLASLTGLLLIVVARGLHHRIALARVVAIGLLLTGAVFSLSKALDWEDSLVLVLLAGLLQANAGAFHRKGDWRSFRPTQTWFALIIIALGAAALLGFFAYRHVEYREALWWQFAWDGNAPRFLRASAATVIVAAALALDLVINRPSPPRGGGAGMPDVVRDILATSGETRSALALLGDKSFLVSDDGKAFIMYAIHGRSWITMGDPVGEEHSARSLIWQFAEMVDRAGGRVVFYAAQPRFLPTYLELGLAILKIGELARVDLASFSLEGAARQSFRYAASRARREGLEFSIIPKEGVPTILPELRDISRLWMLAKSGHEKGFSLGRFEDEYICQFDCAVLRKEGHVVAFANLWRAGSREELSVDLMRYRPGVSGVVMEALFANLLSYGKADGYRWFNLGAAPLAGLADHPLASTWNRIGTFIYRHGDEFYNFEGLRSFKQKFAPVWTPQYIVCHGGLLLPQILLDVTSLISRGRSGQGG